MFPFDFFTRMKDCEITDPGFTSNILISCNGRSKQNRISMRLDRIMHSDEWSVKFQTTRVDHLSKIGSDHNLLLVSCDEDNHQVINILDFSISGLNKKTSFLLSKLFGT